MNKHQKEALEIIDNINKILDNKNNTPTLWQKIKHIVRKMFLTRS